MSRIENVQSYINSIFDKISDDDEKRVAYIHTYGVAQECALLAAKRGLNSELATVIGLLHDVYSYKTGVRPLHSHNGAEMIRVAFKYDLTGLFLEDEQTIIKSAIYHHTDKEHTHDNYDELLKDCDVLQHYIYDAAYGNFNGLRLERVALEIGIDVPKTSQSNGKKVKRFFNQRSVGDIAEKLASGSISGKRSNPEYMEIIKYYPEQSAFNELDHAWCAAFVYHCCIKAGLALPLRTPHTAKEIADCRFACVVAWYEWANRHGYCKYEKDGYIPQRGDIVLYNNIIPKENKPENSTWCDHIGVVLSCVAGCLSVAEGNVDNKNISGIINRKRDDSIGCYIRIPEDYEYDEWKTDFKTGNYRVDSFA
ncbi:MAG: HD domain-containing protein [Clostridia bacterium]